MLNSIGGLLDANYLEGKIEEERRRRKKKEEGERRKKKKKKNCQAHVTVLRTCSMS